MELHLKSKLLHSVDYDASSKQLTVFLTNGHRREFVDVPPHVIDDLKTCGSPGSYYVKRVKNCFPAPRE